MGLTPRKAWTGFQFKTGNEFATTIIHLDSLDWPVFEVSSLLVCHLAFKQKGWVERNGIAIAKLLQFLMIFFHNKLQQLLLQYGN